MRVLVVAVSARMLAELAVADGYQVADVDRFGDVDLRAQHAVARVATARRSGAQAALAADLDADAVVYGAGFENRPDLVAKLARRRELLGTPPDLLAAVRDPWAVGAAARAAGARAPETRSRGSVPDGAGAWLRKPRRGGGGRGVRRWEGGRLRTSEILQRLIGGLSCSAVAIGDGRRATVIGVTEQLHRSPGFAWIGNVAPPRLPAAEQNELLGRLGAVCSEVAARFGVRGAFGVDAVWDGRDPWVLEVNPRPPASLELFGPGTFEAHVAGSRGLGLPAAGPTSADCTAAALRGGGVKLVLFAERDVRAPDPDWWPEGLVRDIPTAGETIGRGTPVCTLISRTDSPPELAARGAGLMAALPEAVRARA